MSSSISSPVTVSGQGFTGTSKYASSLQQVLARAVGIAALPLQSLSARLGTLTDKQSALQSLDSVFANLQSSIASLAKTAQSGNLSSSVSDGGVVNASVDATAAPGVYSIEVVSLGGYSTALSSAGTTQIANPATEGLNGSSTYTLTAGGATTSITAASTSLNDLVSAINEQASGDVQATIVNAGSSGAPDYRLSLRATKLGANPIGLADSLGNDLISASSAGSLASYKVNGLSGAISTDSRLVSLAPGLTVTLVGQSPADQAATITVSHDATALASGFSSFVRAYNSAASALAQYHGEGAGVLQGESILSSLGSALRQLGTFSNGSPQESLAAFGITPDKDGTLSIDTSAFQSASTLNFSTLLSVLGGTDTGGFLKVATNALTAAEDPIHGSIKEEESALTSQITAQQTKIAAEQDRVVQFQTALTAQIARADAAIAQLESQVSYVSGLFAQYTGYNSNNQQS